MDYITGKPRTQLGLIESSLEEKIEQDNPVRIIDAFVDGCKLEEFDFKHAKHASEGQPPYHPRDLLKLFIYGYLNRIRSSRLLERECKRNLEQKFNLNIIKLKEENNAGVKVRAIIGILFFIIPFGYELLWIYFFNEYNNYKISIEKFISFLPVESVQ